MSRDFPIPKVGQVSGDATLYSSSNKSGANYLDRAGDAAELVSATICPPGFIEPPPLLKISSIARAYAPVVCTEDVVKTAGHVATFSPKPPMDFWGTQRYQQILRTTNDADQRDGVLIDHCSLIADKRDALVELLCCFALEFSQ